MKIAIVILLAAVVGTVAWQRSWGQAGVPGGFAPGVPQNAIGNAGPSPPAGCSGVIDASAGCPLPMLGM